MTTAKATTLYIDCEFNSFMGSLMSIALVSHDGSKEFYGVGPRPNHPHPWVVEHVIPALFLRTPSVIGSDIEVTLAMGAFLSQFQAVHIVADWPEDIAYFCRALITGPGTRINTPPITMEIRRDLDAVSAIPHNALADAWAIRDLAVLLSGDKA